ncbi:hypothetical protein A2U01_0096445 [Trifolium medium]|uniref:Uncharacterized protein n=1 Tax=Trifolium medium TaxID=97028 RepID=A0A392UR12_9FABA|nr:hypothetical protein [Trifolium medium]
MLKYLRIVSNIMERVGEKGAGNVADRDDHGKQGDRGRPARDLVKGASPSRPRYELD